MLRQTDGTTGSRAGRLATFGRHHPAGGGVLWPDSYRDPACSWRDHRRRLRWVHGYNAPASQAPASAEPGASAFAPAEGGIKEGGTLVVAIPGDIKRTDPALIDDSNTSYVMQNVMEGLVTLKPGTTGELQPAWPRAGSSRRTASRTRSRSARA